MTKKNKTLWIGKDDLNGDKQFIENSSKEFFDVPMANDLADNNAAGLLSGGTSRRDFLKYLGFSLGAATIAASCDAPVRRAIPYVNQPDAIVPGVPSYYATHFAKGGDYCPVVVKTREGRPIKIEGNKLADFTKGGTSARAQASVLSLYDSNRYQNPQWKDGKKISWKEVDSTIQSKLGSSARIRLVSNTNLSPFTAAKVEAFVNAYPGTEWVMYDPVSNAAMLDAYESASGVRAIPSMHFDKADVVVSLGADFLGTWISPVEFASDFSQNRKIKDPHHPKMSRLYVIEDAMSLTGSNADNRIIIRPSESGIAAALLYNEIAKKAGASTFNVSGNFKNDKAESKIKLAAADLWKSSQSNKGTLVVCGSNNLGEQLLTIEINNLLHNFGKTIDTATACHLRKGSDKALGTFAADMAASKIDAVIFLDDANPVYDTPYGNQIADGLDKLDLSISMASSPNETSSLCTYVCPAHNYLESWGDVMPKDGVYGLVQPTIEPLFDTRSREESLAVWTGSAAEGNGEDRADYVMLKEHFENNIYNNLDTGGDMQSVWEKTLHDGLVSMKKNSNGSSPSVNVSEASSKIGAPSGNDNEVRFYETVNIGAGQYADNPWLQEMPDPLYRTVWSNFLTIPLSWDGKRKIRGLNNWETGDIVSATIGGNEVSMPVVEQFGVANGVHGLALGYGRTEGSRAARGVGLNVYPMMTSDDEGYTVYYAAIELGNKVGHDDEFATVQYHHSYGVKDADPETGDILNIDEQSIATIATGYQGALMDRSVMYYTDLDELDGAIETLHHKREHAQHLNKETIYTGHEDLHSRGHKWSLSVDLSACIGCGACQVACIAENNVPVVGKKEVSRHHEMTWLRIDRYFFGDMESPNVVYQPLMCQHCDNAPCENVCPVGATQHSSEGLNHMTYNRCIGTRYCANNCPYKVRRFNWLDYTAADLFGSNASDPMPNASDVPFYGENLTRMVLNPDVTVRSRGVIEKCSMCIQRIQAGKLQAKNERRALVDGDIQTACASACPTGAIVFGDMNNDKSRVKELSENELNYYVLEEINTAPGIGYQMKVTNKNSEINKLDA
jgi:molybdopterin-containing oxidoreductase family iron-sulfur binding subunit